MKEACDIVASLESGAEGDRTLNLSIANAALSQLSYGPESCGVGSRIVR